MKPLPDLVEESRRRTPAGRLPTAIDTVARVAMASAEPSPRVPDFSACYSGLEPRGGDRTCFGCGGSGRIAPLIQCRPCLGGGWQLTLAERVRRLNWRSG